MFEQHCGNNTFFYLGTRLLKRLLLKKRRNSGLAVLFDQITHSPSFSPIRENGGWESLRASVRNSAAAFREISLWEHGRSSSNGSGLRASVRQTVGTGVCARPWRTRRAPHIRPASIIRNGMAVCVQKHEIQKGPLTHPTNPEVAACRAPVFGLRFVVSIIECIENITKAFSDFSGPYFYVRRSWEQKTCQWFFSALGF